MKLALLTCSYAPDFERCRQLCRSVDRFASGFAEHVLIVPRRDHALFAPLLRDGRRMVAAEKLLPNWIGRIPRSRRWWWSARSLPVRGWIVQQIIKLSAFEACADDVNGLVFVDSDVQLVRAFSPEPVLQDGRLRLHRVPGHGKKDFHLRWHRSTAKLLGLPATDYFGADYIAQLVSWRRDHVTALQRHISEQSGSDWRATICRTLHFSEYTLYGIFVEHVLGASGDTFPGHYADDRDLCHCSWDHPDRVVDRERLIDFLNELEPHHAAVLIQSNLGLDEGQCDELIRQRREAGPIKSAPPRGRREPVPTA